MFNQLLWSFKGLPDSYIALDTETTGLFLGDVSPDVVSIGLTEVKGSETISSVEYLSKPMKKFTDNAAAVHGFSWEEVRSNPELSDSWDDICNIIEGRLVIAHNALFDWRVLISAATTRSLKLPNVEGVFCTRSNLGCRVLNFE